ncbi:uncharacterized protein EI90DRAFT_2904905 [Cantharellus anzutake]|uniref:uncharacterized protein n=1 Tax=Cantharellus anzutake TaxID=1750568 RepID=UPI0019051416|nr:uncharacterized protein EI90DRAFT_2904905 [Cantharellus anzutake]KAF8341409.1 hypothetical protein EI90DRAFT_2904905 [Cantharellus anzutake]
MHSEGSSSLNFQPRLQLLSFKRLGTRRANPDTPGRYGLVVSDGDHFYFAVLSTGSNYLLDENILEKNYVFTLAGLEDEYAVGSSIIISLSIFLLLHLHIVCFNERIGSPTLPRQRSDTNAPTAAKAAIADPPSPTPGPSTTEADTPRNAPTENPPATLPIEGLNPYQSGRTIKVRVVQKSKIRRWSNNRGEGKYFNCMFVDETGEIRATAFNGAVDEHYEKLQEGKVYYVSRARLKDGSSTNKYEMILERTSEIKEANSQYSFIEPSQMASQQHGAVVGTYLQSQLRAGSRLTVGRDLMLVDNTGYSIRLTVRGNRAEYFDNHTNPVVAVKGARVNNSSTTHLDMPNASYMQVEPDNPQAHVLRRWYDQGGKAETFRPQVSSSGPDPSFSGFNNNEPCPIAIAQEKFPGLGDTPDYFVLHATVVLFGENVYYMSCPGPNCQKKVLEQDDGTWRCERCAKSYVNCKYRYLMGVSVADHTGQLFLQGFNEIAEQLLGISAKDYHDLIEDSDAARAKLVEAKYKVWDLSCRVKQETYNGVTRPRYVINRVFAPDYAKEGLRLLEFVERYPSSKSA